MELQEGQILRGTLSLSGGGDGPRATWIVVAPYGKQHLHSIDDPLDTHVWPAYGARLGLEQGALEAVGLDPAHPAVQLQRAKEAHGVKDAHLGLQGEAMERMLALLAEAVAQRAPYARYAAGEILALMRRALHGEEYRNAVESRVWELLARLDAGPT